MPAIHWDTGTAYDFFVSLFVLHRAADFGLRPSWAAGVRQRVPSPKREFLERICSFAAVPLAWILTLPQPKDAPQALRAIADLAPADRLPALTLIPETPPEVCATLFSIAKQRAWQSPQQDFLRANYLRRGEPLKPAALTNLLELWADPAGSGEMFLAALQEYYHVFFVEEEAHLRPALEKELARAQELAARLSVDALIEELSRGVHFEALKTVAELTLAPSYWSSPLVFITKAEAGKALLLFGARREVLPRGLVAGDSAGVDESFAPSAETPDLLVIALKSLADPTRLRILRYLAAQPLTPTELARRLRLRPPTVIHHLNTLRLAGLVHITVSENNARRYAARLETLKGINTALNEFLGKQD